MTKDEILKARRNNMTDEEKAEVNLNKAEIAKGRFEKKDYGLGGYMNNILSLVLSLFNKI